MQYNKLGESDLHISELCLGTMTFGQQNTIADAHQQLDYAIAQGINFIDTAEMYPVPARAETQGATEAYIGEWLKKQPRDKLIIATKIAGPGRGMKWLREGAKAIDRANIQQAIDGSLKRLQTDYVDLYQIHWPDRNVPIFGQTEFDPKKERSTIAIEEQLSYFAEFIQTGKIRYLGVSNETPWGVCQFVNAARSLGLPKIVSIQNAYNLINRTFEMGLSEVCHREAIGTLAYSPLAFGTLSGKYLQAKPDTARMTLFPNFGSRYRKPNVEDAIAAYSNIAHRFSLTPATLALAFVRSRWFVTSAIVGATSLEQLKENIASVDVELSPEILEAIESVHERYPNPAP